MQVARGRGEIELSPNSLSSHITTKGNRQKLTSKLSAQMFPFQKCRRKGDEKQRGSTGFGAVVLMERSVLGRSGRAAVSRRRSRQQQPLPSRRGAAHRRASSLARRGTFACVVTQLGWESPGDRSSGTPYTDPGHRTPLRHTWARSGALPFTGRVLCATAARWLKGKREMKW